MLLQHAVVAACDGALAIVGQRVVGADGGHRLRLRTVERLLAPDNDLFDQLDEVRSGRNQVSYAAGFATLVDADDASEHVTALIELIDVWVTERLPDWAQPTE